MLKLCATALLLMASGVSALAAEPTLICFGNEPSWSLAFAGPDAAQLMFPDGPAVEYRGRQTRLDVLKESAWRGTPSSGGGGDLVAFLRESTCSDGMSDVKHPLTARVSLADGRFLAGCCRIPAASGAEPAESTPLQGTVWRLTGLSGLDPGVLAAAKRPATIRFEAGRVEGFFGCNQFAGGYRIEGAHAVLGPMAGTMMACQGPAMTIEDALSHALAGTVGYAITGDRLVLTSASGATLAFQAEPQPTLEGVTWEVTGYNNGRSAVVSPLADTKLTLSFNGGAVAGFSGCNTFSATSTVEGNRVTITGLASTRKACAGEDVMAQERDFQSALSSATQWEIRGGMLDMHRADGERVLTANSSPP
jgi:heat shock protein HslJ